jgi:hypothetical protein
MPVTWVPALITAVPGHTLPSIITMIGAMKPEPLMVMSLPPPGRSATGSKLLTKKSTRRSTLLCGAGVPIRVVMLPTLVTPAALTTLW